ncbi:hypothetical protein COU78_02390 [Candidatus Peregrinibacteria bacterium CG10_big_fil_rev_8_21_14_0_10_49_24]|nr:MAG: hypothetical protein COV83_02370 [Candidatus Peregrinibacteria bacterium CG11_big_fil_rev_8_21_14_0_20_49_14]PIR50986.1 MAG: hypothetical protein COU78_02390 [Candidatus Peregrinibacteria bacterium CG10_big_fil_rev_8_21_14_0_10_49_24]PJA67539.1 MAG: hypothetical protein CO157_03870 [Candidatus Peregrinibacteria bacterium CG_4_9_14_3_um_filter_49_12]
MSQVYDDLHSCTMNVLQYFMVSLLGALIISFPQYAVATERTTKFDVSSANVQISSSQLLRRKTTDTPVSNTVPVAAEQHRSSSAQPPASVSSRPTGTPPLSPASLPVSESSQVVQDIPTLPEDQSVSQSPNTPSFFIVVEHPKGNALRLTSAEVTKALTILPQSKQGLTDYAAALVQSDDRIEKIQIDDGGVSLVYRQQAKIFGFVPVSFALHTHVDTSGIVSIHKPFWLFLASDSSREVQKNVEQELHGTRNAPVHSDTHDSDRIASFFSLLGALYDSQKNT